MYCIPGPTLLLQASGLCLNCKLYKPLLCFHITHCTPVYFKSNTQYVIEVQTLTFKQGLHWLFCNHSPFHSYWHKYVKARVICRAIGTTWYDGSWHEDMGKSWWWVSSSLASRRERALQMWCFLWECWCTVSVDKERPSGVPREKMWYCMRKPAMAEKCVRMVEDIYEDG